MGFLFRRSDKAIPIIISTDSIVMLATAMLGPIYALFVDEIGGTLLDASLAGAVFALAAGITTIFGGRLTDKIKEKELIVVVGYLIISAGFFLMTQVRTIELLFVIQALIGLGEALYVPAFDTLFSEHTKKRRAGRQWGAWESMYYFTTAIGAVVGGIIVTQFGFSPMFVVMGIMCVASAFYIYFLPRKVL